MLKNVLIRKTTEWVGIYLITRLVMDQVLRSGKFKFQRITLLCCPVNDSSYDNYSSSFDLNYESIHDSSYDSSCDSSYESSLGNRRVATFTRNWSNLLGDVASERAFSCPLARPPRRDYRRRSIYRRSDFTGGLQPPWKPDSTTMRRIPVTGLESYSW